MLPFGTKLNHHLSTRQLFIFYRKDCRSLRVEKNQSVKVAGNHVNEIHDFCKQLNFSRLGCLCRRRFALHFAWRCSGLVVECQAVCNRYAKPCVEWWYITANCYAVV